MPKKPSNSDSSEPYYYIALVLKGTEEQYAKLLKHINSRNGSQIIYQCKSLTYLHVTRGDGIKTQVAGQATVLTAQGGAIS